MSILSNQIKIQFLLKKVDRIDKQLLEHFESLECSPNNPQRYSIEAAIDHLLPKFSALCQQINEFSENS